MKAYMNTYKKDIYYTLLFALFLVTYMITLSVTDGFVKGLDSPEGKLLRYIPGIARILGFISFYISRHFILDPKKRRITPISAGILFLISTAILMSRDGKNGVIPFLIVIALAIGHLGGLVYYCLAVKLTTNDHKGRIIGISCSLSILIQFLLTGDMNVYAQLILSAALSVFVILATTHPPADFVLEDPLPYSNYNEGYVKEMKLQLLGIVLIILTCSLIASRTDIAFVSMSFEGSVDIYSYPRLLMIPGYLIMGLVADSSRSRLFPTVFFCSVLFSAILTLMPFQNSGYAFFLGVYYFFISVYIFFYTYSFISIAPRTHKPELFASLGRPLAEIFISPISFILMNLGDERLNASPVSYTIYYMFLIIVLYVIMTVIKVDPNLTICDASEDMPQGAHRDLEKWLDACLLTPREKDVARLLIGTDEPIKAIASDLGISERSVYRYSASIYEKTGTDNRNGLIRSASYIGQNTKDTGDN